MAQWITSYFNQTNIAARNPATLSWVVPSIIREPSIFTFSFSDYDAIVELGAGSSTDITQFFTSASQLHDSYRRANFDSNITSALPKMRRWMVTGDSSPAFALYGMYVVQNDNDAAGGGVINFKLVPGINHFVRILLPFITSCGLHLCCFRNKVHWDDPAKTLQIYSSLS